MHHGSVVQISDRRIVVEDVINDCSTGRNLLSLPTKFLIIVMDLDERDLLFEPLPGGSVHAAISDFWELGLR